MPTALCLLFLLLSAPALAQQDDKARANAKAEEAVAAFGSGDFARAAGLFHEAYDIYEKQSLKLNEMIAFYKADECEGATAAATTLLGGNNALAAGDRSNVARVTSDCNYRAAKLKFDAGDLDGAQAVLEGIDEDGEFGREIGALLSDIEKRREELAQQEQDPLDISPTVSPAGPPPSWALFTGLGLSGLGGALGVTTLIKWLVERAQLSSGFDEIGQAHGCVYDSKNTAFADDGAQTCDAAAALADPRYRDFADGVESQSTVNGILGVSAAVLGVSGAGVLIYYFVKKGKYDNYVDSQPQVLVLPDVRPGFAGAVFQLRF